MDSEKLCAQKEGTAFQSEWELLALFFSVFVFYDVVSASLCQVTFVSDSQAALGAASRLRSPAAFMGALEHVVGTGNKSADALSRPSEGAALPQLLDHMARLPAPDRETAFNVWPWRLCLGRRNRIRRLFVNEQTRVQDYAAALSTGTTV